MKTVSALLLLTLLTTSVQGEPRTTNVTVATLERVQPEQKEI